MLNDNLALRGALTVRKNGKVIHQIDNLIVTTGKNLVAASLGGGATTITHMAIGTGTTAAAITDTTLETELDRNALTNSGGTVSGNTIQFDCTWAAGDGTGALSEAGLFSAASGGIMLARKTFAVVNKSSLDTVSISWTVTVS